MKPFNGLTFCPTGINDEDASKSLAKKIIKLGGNFSKDLTRQVNILVLGSKFLSLTNKYKFAVKNRPDILFLDISTINEMYQLWISGEDITFTNHSNFSHVKNQTKRMFIVLKSRFQSNPLENFFLFIGRIGSHPVADLEKIANSMGVFKCNSKHFVKDAHLNNTNKNILFISESLSGARVNAAVQQGLPIVHYKWLIDCQKRNAILEYDPYYLLQNLDLTSLKFDDIGIQACHCWDTLLQTDNPTTSSSAALLMNNTTPTKSVSLNRFKPKVDKLWDRAMKLDTNSHNDNALPSVINETKVKESPDKVQNSIFINCTFKINDKFPAKHYNIMVEIIKQNKGSITTSDLIDPDYHIVPSTVALDTLKLIEQETTHVVTEFFIERCLHYKKLISPIDSWSKPFLKTDQFRVMPSKALLHNPDSNTLVVTITGFQGVELLHLTKILNVLKNKGITFTEVLNKSTDLLLINLSSLPSIPETHQLWNNSYSDLFKLSSQANNQNVVFRNSLKKKIQFVKKNHSIPVVTPAFIIDLLKNVDNVLNNSVFINNVNWCIICPKGRKNDFECVIEHTKRSHTESGAAITPTNTVSPTMNQNSNINSSLQQTKNELLSKMKQSNNQKLKLPRKRIISNINNMHNMYPQYSDLKQVPIQQQQNSSHQDETSPSKKLKTLNKSIPPIERTSSWGTMMTNELPSKINSPVDASSLQVPDSSAESILPFGHTQVTYGNHSDHPNKNEKEKPSRRLTRKQMKEIES